jgi:hypothetical protein
MTDGTSLLGIPECSVPKCPNRAKTRGWCGKHYERWRKYGDPEYVKSSPLTWNEPPCRLDGCENPAYSRGLCRPHWTDAHWLGIPW